MSLRTFRENADLTREQVAPRLGIALSTLARWEKGISSVPADIILDIAKLYKVKELEILKALKQQKQA